MASSGRRHLWILIPALLIITTMNALARHENGHAVIVIPRVTSAPRIDGVLSDSSWRAAVRLDEFFQYTPHNGTRPSERTVSYLMYDRDNLFVGFRCFDSAPSKIRATLAPRNQWRSNDNAFIYLDTYDTKRDNYLFMINPLGVQYNSFDTIWRSAGRIDSLGWTGEMAIPFKSLRFPNGEEQEWGIVLGRNIYRKGEILNTVDCAYDEDFNALFQKARGMRDMTRGHNVELLPYTAGRHSAAPNLREREMAAGLDAKIGLATNLTLDASLAPDFSQVESDPFFVNFTPYEYALAEHRPFFSEGAAIFALPHTIFYSRRIENPQAMGKLTGKEGPWTVGLISAWDEPVDGQQRLIHVERVQRDVLSTSKVGLMVAGLESESGHCRSVSIDGNLKRSAEHQLSFQWAATLSSEAATSGNALGYASYVYRQVEGLNLSVAHIVIGANYQPVTGLVGQTGYQTSSASVGYNWHIPAWGIETLSLTGSGSQSETTAGLGIGQSAGVSLSVAFIERLYGSLSVASSRGRSQIKVDESLVWDPRQFSGESFGVTISTQTGAALDGHLGYSRATGGVYADDFTRQERGRSRSLSMGLTLRPRANLLITSSGAWHHQQSLETDEVLVDSWLVYNSIQLQATRRLFSRLIHQLDVRNEAQQLDFLVGYELHAGSTFYVSYKEYRRGDDLLPGREHYAVFGKMSYLFRI